MPKPFPPKTAVKRLDFQVPQKPRKGCHLRDGQAFFGLVLLGISLACLTTSGGCGTTKAYDATEQLLLSEAVDDSISHIDFRPMSGYRVFLDAQYIKNIKSVGFVNSDYVISSLRQQIVGAGCLLQDKQEDADLIIEARCGTLGADSFQVVYGIPANSFLATAAQLIPGTPPLPVIPDLSLARREAREGASKIAAFAYDRVTRQPIWQSGIFRANATSRDTWVMGVGPIQTGSVRKGTRWVGSGLEIGNQSSVGSSPHNLYERSPVEYDAEVRFEEGQPVLGPNLTIPKLLQSDDNAGELPGAGESTTQAETVPPPQPAEPAGG